MLKFQIGHLRYSIFQHQRSQSAPFYSPNLTAQFQTPVLAKGQHFFTGRLRTSPTTTRTTGWLFHLHQQVRNRSNRFCFTSLHLATLPVSSIFGKNRLDYSSYHNNKKNIWIILLMTWRWRHWKYTRRITSWRHCLYPSDNIFGVRRKSVGLKIIVYTSSNSSIHLSEPCH